jgi:hypothetical protein
MTPLPAVEETAIADGRDRRRSTRRMIAFGDQEFQIVGKLALDRHRSWKRFDGAKRRRIFASGVSGAAVGRL